MLVTSDEINQRFSDPCQSILIIEDDDLIRSTLRFALEMDNYVVHEARNGQEGLEKLRSLDSPCLILLDLMMPVMNGWQFADAVHQDRSLWIHPMIVMTAFAGNTKSILAQGLIRKPVDLDELSQMIRRWFGPAK